MNGMLMVRYLLIGVLLLSGLLCATGCYRRPSADTIGYDVDVVETLRHEIEAVEWDE